MARRYSRDNQGRFASGGTGATARGGRLKTASGNKRATQTTKAAAAKPSGSIAGKVKRNPAAAGKIGQQAKAVAPKAAGRKKTEQQVLQQADRLMGKLSKRQASIDVNKTGLNEGLRQVRKNNARAGRVNSALNSRGLLGKYTKLTAPADAIRMTPAGPGIKQPRAAAKPAAPKAARRKAIGAISEAKAGRIISRIDANRPGLRKATGSARKTQNSIRTQGKATDFALAAGARARKQGKSLSVNESLQRGVKNAAVKSRKSPKAATPAATAPAKPRRQVTETQLGNAAKRAKKVEISRYLSESDKMNAGGKETFAKRFAAFQFRSEKGKRTSQAAKAFLSNYGTPSLFGQRPVLSTKDSPRFGAKKRKRR